MKLSRRTFISSVAAASVQSTNVLAKSAVLTHTSPSTTKGFLRNDGYILPPSIKEGATIAVTAPASGVKRDELDSGIEFLKQLGIKVVLGKCIYRNNGFLSAPDEQRAAEFMEFIERSDVDGIMCARGGYGVMRILPMLNFDTIRNNPKPVIGYSDITALLIAILNKSKVISYHGPVCSSEFDTITTTSFIQSLITNKQSPDPMSPPIQQIVYQDSGFDVIANGQGAGKLVGGNLTMICSTLGTPYEIDTKDSILFLEDVSEEPYKIDRMLTQLWLAGKLDYVSGIALGVFKNCDPYRRGDKSKNEDLPAALREVFESRLGMLKAPVVSGLPFGHVKSKLTLPLGVNALLDAESKSLSFMEPSVS